MNLPTLPIRHFNDNISTVVGSYGTLVRPFIMVRGADDMCGFVWLDPRSYVEAEEVIRHAAYSSPVPEQTPTNWLNIEVMPGGTAVYITRMVGLAQVLATPHLRATLQSGDSGSAFLVQARYREMVFTGVWADSIGAAARFVRDVGVYFSALPR